MQAQSLKKCSLGKLLGLGRGQNDMDNIYVLAQKSLRASWGQAAPVLFIVLLLGASSTTVERLNGSNVQQNTKWTNLHKQFIPQSVKGEK